MKLNQLGAPSAHPEFGTMAERDFGDALGMALAIMSVRQTKTLMERWARQRELINSGRIDREECIRRVIAAKAAAGGEGGGHA